MKADALAGLRDYHLPESHHWWPPAPGWWLLALSGVLGIALLWLLRRRHRRRLGASGLALGELAALRERWAQDADDMALVRGLAQLLRRYALARWPADEAAGLSGAAWLDYLTSKWADAPAPVREALTGSLGQAITDAAYRSSAEVDAASLADAAAALIRHASTAREQGTSR